MGGAGAWGAVRRKLRLAIHEIARLRKQNDALFLIVGVKVADEIESLKAKLRKYEAADACPDAGSCHGAMKWCDRCGDVRDLCDDPICDAHYKPGAEATQ